MLASAMIRRARSVRSVFTLCKFAQTRVMCTADDRAKWLNAIEGAKPTGCDVTLFFPQRENIKFAEDSEKFIMPFIRTMVDSAQGAENDLACSVVGDTIVCECKVGVGRAILETDSRGRPIWVNWTVMSSGHAMVGHHWLKYD